MKKTDSTATSASCITPFKVSVSDALQLEESKQPAANVTEEANPTIVKHFSPSNEKQSKRSVTWDPYLPDKEVKDFFHADSDANA